MLVAVFLLLALVLVNAFYVAAEFAIVAVRKSRVAQLAEEGSASAQRVLAVLDDGHQLDRYVAACQIGITLSSLVVGAYGQAAFTPSLAVGLERWGLGPASFSAAAILVLVVLTAAQVVFGELAPKSLALEMPARIALFVSLPMKASLRLYSLFISVLNGSALLLLRPFGVSPTGHGHVHTADEIDLLLQESHEQGALGPEEQEALRKALRLGARPVRQLMVPRARVDALDIDSPTEVALERAAKSPYTRLVVYRGSLDRALGVVHTKDLVGCRVETERLPPLVELVRRVPRVEEETRADRVLEVFRERRVSLAVVVDKRRRVVGITTVGDVLSALLGEVGDELKDVDPRAFGPVSRGRLRMAGQLTRLVRPPEGKGNA